MSSPICRCNDSGDPDELAQDYRVLRAARPHVTVLGGCCSTNHRHISAISSEFSPAC